MRTVTRCHAGSGEFRGLPAAAALYFPPAKCRESRERPPSHWASPLSVRARDTAAACLAELLHVHCEVVPTAISDCDFCFHSHRSLFRVLLIFVLACRRIGMGACWNSGDEAPGVC